MSVTVDLSILDEPLHEDDWEYLRDNAPQYLDRVEKALRQGATPEQVFPALHAPGAAPLRAMVKSQARRYALAGTPAVTRYGFGGRFPWTAPILYRSSAGRVTYHSRLSLCAQVAPVNQLTNSVRSNVKLSGDLGKTKNYLHTGIVAPGREKNQS